MDLDTARVVLAPAQAYRTNRELVEYQDVPSDGPIPIELQKDLKKSYYACASFTDDNIGAILSRLQELGLYDNTLIVFLGDHGYHQGEQGLWCKSTNFESSCNAPLIIKMPSKKGRALPHRVDRPVSFIDLMPTVCTACRVPVPDGAMGEDLLGSAEHNPYVFSQIAHSHNGIKYMGYAIRDTRWTYVEWFTPEMDCAAAELYDMAGRDTCRYEKINVLEAHPDIAATLSEALHGHLDRVLSGRSDSR